MELTNEQVDELIAHLQGSCKSLDEGCQDMFEKDEDVLTSEQLLRIDQEIFHCATCGWWYEISEESGSDESDLICNDCAENEG